jgi:hypothetical protein
MSSSITFSSVSEVVNQIGSHIPGSTGSTNLFSAFREFFGANGDLSKFYSNFSTKTGLSSSAYKLAQNYYFRTTFTFNPVNSFVFNRLKSSLVDISAEPIKFLVQRADLPNFTLQKHKNPPDSNLSEHEWGYINSPGLALPDSDMFDIAFLSTERSLHEDVFYYWMREAAATFWTYENQPFTTANVTFEFLDAKYTRPYLNYIFTGVYPINIKLMDPNQLKNDEFQRVVKFQFSGFYVRYPTLFGNTPLGNIWQDISPALLR